ncbi:hypothetical protein VNI00_015062 [Paramarasmius palmivorus]|uniref:F-box domain-containing protein n=1 Tax=Paramarasmius palmivorus TaxID=297713 RepID=A0AAW0BQZ8_9AGAR
MHLPQELADKIVTEHKGCPTDLKACSLIARAWVAQTRSPGYLFTQLQPMNDEKLSVFIQSFDQPKTNLVTLRRGSVQSMSLEKPLQSPDFAALLPTLPNASSNSLCANILDVLGGVVTLNMRTINASDWMDFGYKDYPRARTLHIFHSVRILNLHDVRFGSPQHFHDVLSSLPSLEELSWKNARASPSPFFMSSGECTQLTRLPKLQKITICLHMFTPSLKSIILSLSTYIRQWTLLDVSTRELKVMGQLFREAGARGVSKQRWTMWLAREMEKHRDAYELGRLKRQVMKAIDLTQNARIESLVFHGKLWSTLLSSYVIEHLGSDGLEDVQFHDL